jgi:hypothetical protein
MGHLALMGKNFLGFSLFFFIFSYLFLEIQFWKNCKTALRLLQGRLLPWTAFIFILNVSAVFPFIFFFSLL